MNTRAALVVGALLLVVAWGSGTASADVGPVPDVGWHRVRHEAYVDLGTFVDCDTWRYVVKSRETLGEIAERELGSARRHREILALNVGLTPRRLWAGARIVMPPRSARCQGREPRYVFFVWTPDAHGWAAPRRLGDGAVHQVSHGARLYAVPGERLTSVLARATENGLDGHVLDGDPAIARSGPIRLLTSLPDADPTRRIVTQWRLVGVEDGCVVLKRVAEERYDVEGRLLQPSGSESSGPSVVLQLLAFILMLGGLGWAVHVSQRSVPAEASSSTT